MKPLFSWKVIKGCYIEQANAILWILVLLCAWYLLRLLFQLVAVHKRGNKLPGPSSSLWYRSSQPLTKGHSHSGLSELLRGLHRSHGPVARLWQGPSRMVVSVCDPELAKYVLAHAKDKPSREQAIKPAFDCVLVASDKEVKQQRSFLDYHFHTTLIFKGQQIAAGVALRALDSWRSTAAEGRELDVRSACQDMTTRVLGTALFGTAFQTNDVASRLRPLLLRVADGEQRWRDVYLVPPVWSSEYRSYQASFRELKTLLRELMHLATRASKEAQEAQPERGTEGGDATAAAAAAAELEKASAVCAEEFVVAMLAEEMEGGKRLYTAETAADTALGLVFHGCLGVSTLLSRIFVLLAQHSDVQAKVHAEIDWVCNGHKPPTAEHMSDMHYLTAVVHEALRLTPVSSVLQRCCIESDLEVGGHKVPARTPIYLPTRVMQMDHRIWGEDVHHFKPERFVRTRQGQVSTHSRSALVARENAAGWDGETTLLGVAGSQLLPGGDVASLTTLPPGIPAASLSLGPRELSRRYSADSIRSADEGSSPGPGQWRPRRNSDLSVLDREDLLLSATSTPTAAAAGFGIGGGGGSGGFGLGVRRRAREAFRRPALVETEELRGDLQQQQQQHDATHAFPAPAPAPGSSSRASIDGGGGDASDAPLALAPALAPALASASIAAPAPALAPDLATALAQGLAPSSPLAVGEGSPDSKEKEQYAFVDPGAGPYFLALGGGPRACLGRSFAVHQVRILVATLLQQFQVKMAPGSPAHHEVGSPRLRIFPRP